MAHDMTHDHIRHILGIVLPSLFELDPVDLVSRLQYARQNVRLRTSANLALVTLDCYGQWFGRCIR
jgi:hypothetical protein